MQGGAVILLLVCKVGDDSSFCWRGRADSSLRPRSRAGMGNEITRLPCLSPSFFLSSVIKGQRGMQTIKRRIPIGPERFNE